MTPQCNLPIGYSNGAALKIMPETQSIVRGLEALMTLTSEDRVAMGAIGYDLVKKELFWSKIAKEMLLVYNWMVRGTKPPECIRFE